MRQRRFTVAFREIESPQARMLRHMFTGKVTEDDYRGRRAKLERYWCGADKPPQDVSLRVTPVYNGTEVPANAECEECGINIREVQELMRGPH